MDSSNGYLSSKIDTRLTDETQLSMGKLSIGPPSAPQTAETSNLVVTSNGLMLDFDELFSSVSTTPASSQKQDDGEAYTPPVSSNFLVDNLRTEGEKELMALVDDVHNHSHLPAASLDGFLSLNDYHQEDLKTALLYAVDKVQKLELLLDSSNHHSPVSGYAAASPLYAIPWAEVTEELVATMSRTQISDAIEQALAAACEARELMAAQGGTDSEMKDCAL